MHVYSSQKGFLRFSKVVSVQFHALVKDFHLAQLKTKTHGKEDYEHKRVKKFLEFDVTTQLWETLWCWKRGSWMERRLSPWGHLDASFECDNNHELEEAIFSHRNLSLTVPRFRDWMVSSVCPFQSNCRDIVQSSNEEKSTFYPVAHFKTSIYVTMVHVTKGVFSEAISYKKSKYTVCFSVSSWLRWPFNALISLHSVQS